MWTLLHAAISLTIPEDAVMEHQQHYQHQQQVFIGVSRDDTDRPKLSGLFFSLYYTISAVLFIQAGKVKVPQSI